MAMLIIMAVIDILVHGRGLRPCNHLRNIEPSSLKSYWRKHSRRQDCVETSRRGPQTGASTSSLDRARRYMCLSLRYPRNQEKTEPFPSFHREFLKSNKQPQMLSPGRFLSLFLPQTMFQIRWQGMLKNLPSAMRLTSVSELLTAVGSAAFPVMVWKS